MAATGYAGGDPFKVDVAGATMTGPLVLSGDPVTELGAATKEFVEAEVTEHSSSVSITSPDGTITVGGTATAPTVDVETVEQSQVTGLAAALAALYTKPSGGIPETDLASAVQELLSLAGTALQSAPVTSVAGRGGVVVLAEGDIANLTTDLTALSIAISAETTRAQSAEAARLIAASNLSDLASASTARGNLGLGTAAVLPSTTWPSASGGSSTATPTTAYQHRKDTLANWLTHSSVVLAAGEMAYETDFNCAKVGDGVSTWAALPYLRTPGVWTASSSGLVAATRDGSIFPSQGPPTTGRPIFFPVRIDQAAAISNLITGYVNVSAPTLPTGSFLAMYACSAPGASGGALLGATADFSASVTPTQLELVLSIASNAAGAASSIPAQPIGAWVYLMILTSYTGSASAAAQYVAGRLFGTNLNGQVAGITPRVYTNSSGSTMLTPPLSVPALVQSNSNVTAWLCAK